MLANVERKLPGLFGCTVCRTRYIDEYLKACRDGGMEQLVILGAGYDSRAYRFDKLKKGIKVFEVDHPLTQRLKIDKVKKILGRLPDHVVYVSIDFDKEQLDKRLFESGYDKTLKTLFIWENVTMYITAEAVDNTLAFVAKNSGEGSSILFNYMFRSVVEGTCELDYAKKIRKLHEGLGSLKFGIEEGTIEPFLSVRGFHQVKNVTGQFFKDTYLKGINRNRKVCCLCGFATATVEK